MYLCGLGELCESVLAPCSTRPCKNRGVCRESEDYQSFSCACPTGWQGKHVYVCVYVWVKEASLLSVLMMSSLSFLQSVTSSVGQTCEVDVNECVKSPCRNGGVCVNSMGGFQCRCNPGFTGDLCETDIDDCTPSKIHTYTTMHPEYTHNICTQSKGKILPDY